MENGKLTRSSTPSDVIGLVYGDNEVFSLGTVTSYGTLGLSNGTYTIDTFNNQGVYQVLGKREVRMGKLINDQIIQTDEARYGLHIYDKTSKLGKLRVPQVTLRLGSSVYETVNQTLQWVFGVTCRPRYGGDPFLG